MSKRGSIFDPYKAIIQGYILDGFTRRQTFDAIFGENSGYTYAGFSYYVTQNHIQYPGDLLDRYPNCEKCGSCHYIEPCYERHEEIRFCEETNRQIHKTLKVSPMWCPKRRKDIA